MLGRPLLAMVFPPMSAYNTGPTRPNSEHVTSALWSAKPRTDSGPNGDAPTRRGLPRRSGPAQSLLADDLVAHHAGDALPRVDRPHRPLVHAKGNVDSVCGPVN